MRKYILKAKIFEEEHNPKDAIYAYVDGLKNNENFTDDELLDAVVLFFIAQEYAFIDEYGLNSETQSLAWKYHKIALDKVSKFNTEAYFWRFYIPFILLNEKILNDKEIEQLMADDETAVVYLGKNKTKEQIMKLYTKHNLVKTERSRYIMSTIGKCVSAFGA